MLLPLCVVLVCAGPVLAGGTENRFPSLRGTVSSVSSTSLSATRSGRTLTCAIGKRSPSVGHLRKGGSVMIICRRVRDGFVLWQLKALAPPEGAKVVASALTGNVTALGKGTVTVGSDQEGRVLTCTVPARLTDLVSKLEVGRPVTMRCRGAERIVPQLAQITVVARAAAGGDARAAQEIRGLLSDTGTGNVTVTNGDGPRTLSCHVPAALAAAVATLTVGDSVLMACRGGDLVAIEKIDVPTPLPSPTPETQTAAAPTTPPSPTPEPQPAAAPTTPPSPTPTPQPAAAPTTPPSPTPAPQPVTIGSQTATGCVGVQVPAGSDLGAVTGKHRAGATFCLAAGNYTVTQKVFLEPGDVISGAGRTATVIKAAPNVALLFDYYNPDASGVLTFEHLSMGGANTPHCIKGSCGSVMLSAVVIHASDVRCFDNATTCFSGGTHDLVLTNFECDGNGWHPDSLVITYQSSACIKLTTPGSLTVRDSSFHDNTWDAIWCDHCRHGVIDIRDSRFIHNGRAGLTWEVFGDFFPGDRGLLQGNTFQDNGGNPNTPNGPNGSGGHAGIIISDSSNIEITGNTFQGNLAHDQPGTRAVLMYDGPRNPLSMHDISIHDNVLNQDRIQIYTPRT